jgi:tRNA pseudouridine-54 N-methylase
MCRYVSKTKLCQGPWDNPVAMDCQGKRGRPDLLVRKVHSAYYLDHHRRRDLSQGLLEIKVQVVLKGQRE